jgi:hypothetical protein
MKSQMGTSLAFITTLVWLLSVFSSLATAQSQPIPGTIANNDSIFVDGKTFTITPGKAKGDPSAQMKSLGARDLGPGAIIFRSGEKLYIVDAPLRLPGTSSEGRESVYVDVEQARPNRVNVEYILPKNPEHQKLYDMLKERRALEKVRQILSPFRLPEELTIKTMGCDGVVNAWYERENSKPTISICYEWLQQILQSLPKETTPAGITPNDAAFGQFFWIATHEAGHAMFDIFDVPVFGRQEDAADLFAAYVMLQFGKDEARRMIGGAAWAYRNYIEDYRKNPEVKIRLAGLASSHGQPEERFYNLMCMAYGADPVLFADLTENGYLPPTRSPSCKYEYRTLVYAFRREIAPHIDQGMARQILDATWLSDVPRPDRAAK